MKKVSVLALVILAVFLTVPLITGCVTPPTEPEVDPEPFVEPEPLPPPPLPPPPPPPDTSPPKIAITHSPNLFSPDGDGENDELFVDVNVQSASEIESWELKIYNPLPPYNLFSAWSGEGMPPEELFTSDGKNVSGSFYWDGRSASGELVQSASTYQYELTVSNVYDETVFEGTFETDVLVHRDGNVLRAIVPSIMFAPNTGEFLRGIAEETVENNEYVLQRIAVVLNRPEFITYRVKVEGHANPTTPPGTQARAAEEIGSRNDIGLRPLSEERARAVVDYLAANGVARERLSYVGMGGARVIIEFEDRDNWWQNRRVEFILDSK